MAVSTFFSRKRLAKAKIKCHVTTRGKEVKKKSLLSVGFCLITDGLSTELLGLAGPGLG